MDYLQDAFCLMDAGLDSIDSAKLVKENVRVRGDVLSICGEEFRVSSIDNILVVGAGKAGDKMAIGIEEALFNSPFYKKLSGFINVVDNRVKKLDKIILYGARPFNLNEPTLKGYKGSKEILKRVSSLTKRDLCIVLLSGGASALLPAPVNEITLEEKKYLTKVLMHSGLNINELNTIRKKISFLKGGGLASLTNSKMISLIISDVVGDSLSVIASGPTVRDDSLVKDAYNILLDVRKKYKAEIPSSILNYLNKNLEKKKDLNSFSHVSNYIIGNNSLALEALTKKGTSLGYKVISLGSLNEGEAREEGEELARLCIECREEKKEDLPICILSGGEPVVNLNPNKKNGLGGRNTELVLSSLNYLKKYGHKNITILSFGTDGEDGPTDAAGSFTNEEVLKKAKKLNLDISKFLETHDSYSFFKKTNSLIKTGLTATNVMDIRICLIGKDL